MTRTEKLAALRAAGYLPVRSGELGVTLDRPPWYVPWRKVGPFLGSRKSYSKARKAVERTLEHLAQRQPAPWEQRRREYLEECGRRER